MCPSARPDRKSQMKLNREIFEGLQHRGRRASPHDSATQLFYWLGEALLAYAFVENGQEGRGFLLGRSGSLSRRLKPCPPIRHDGKGTHFDCSIIDLRLAGRPRLGDSPTWRPNQTFSMRGEGSGPAIPCSRARYASTSTCLIFLLIYAHIAFAFWHWFFREDLWESMTGLNGIKDGLRARFLRIPDCRYRLTSDMTSGRI